MRNKSDGKYGDFFVNTIHSNNILIRALKSISPITGAMLPSDSRTSEGFLFERNGDMDELMEMEAAANRAGLIGYVVGCVAVLVMAFMLLAMPAIVSAEGINDEKAVMAIIGEAEDQTYKGMLAVACAIRNRGTLKGVYGLNSNRVKKHLYTVKTEALARKAWKESKNCDIVNSADHWENIKAFKSPVWAKSMEVACTIGDHTFYRPKVVR